MPTFSRCLTKVIVTSFFLVVFSQSYRVNAGCHRYESIGWFFNKKSGERSKNFEGEGAGCGNMFSGFEAFKSKEFSASWNQCFEKANDCNSPRVVLINVKHNFIKLNRLGTSRKYASDGSTIQCVQQQDSNIEYCWKALRLKKDQSEKWNHPFIVGTKRRCPAGSTPSFP